MPEDSKTVLVRLTPDNKFDLKYARRFEEFCGVCKDNYYMMLQIKG